MCVCDVGQSVHGLPGEQSSHISRTGGEEEVEGGSWGGQEIEIQQLSHLKESGHECVTSAATATHLQPEPEPE